LGRADRAPAEPIPKEPERDRVARLLSGRRDQPAPEPRLLDEPEPAGNGRAPLVRRIDADVDPVGAAQLEPDPRQRRSRLGRIPLADRRGPDPVAALERHVVSGPRAQPAPTAD